MVVEFQQVDTFSDWFKQKYFDFQRGQNRVVSVSAFARFLNIRQQTVSTWLLGSNKPRDHETISKLVDKYGAEVYTALGMELPVTDSRLQQLIQNWPSLTEAARQRIMQVLGAGEKDGAKAKPRRKAQRSR